MKILIGVDGSAEALRAVRFAARLTGGLAERSCTLLYVRPSHTGAVVSLGAPDPLLEARLERDLQDAERDVLREAGAILRADGVPVEERVETGPPGPAIVRVAAEGRFDLVVLGNRGHGELKSLLVGSTGDAVLHHASCSVLVVRGRPHPAAERQGGAEGGPASGQRQVRNRVEIQPRPLAGPIPPEGRRRDHRAVVGAQLDRRNVDRHRTQLLDPPPEREIGGHPSGERNLSCAELLGRLERLTRQRVDHRFLEGGRQVGER